MYLFTDCSVSVQKNIGVGGYLFIEDPEGSLENLENYICLNVFEGVTSTEAELRTLIWALNDLEEPTENISVYTDSQNIVSLLERRGRLEGNDFRNSSGEELKHGKSYKEFYKLLDDLNFNVTKVRGHTPVNERNKIEITFSLLDRKTRKELRSRLAV
ncbi:ribonuclease HI [Cerasicoccus arenae]|uniref:RNase H type-1 domain-containing protein n=1 Tax=Cerasicoccus arenae TaxID=424488 RepID=A0A8J3DEX0_9BACT|nr:RNase H family protein [Cerasicoccus arenae]MBK1857836.1 hypothetical protein [Cerasicoccus arenae]GHC11582.1 hypothetical protein GCM10007047_31070 [Cerasicoccus arenae]